MPDDLYIQYRNGDSGSAIVPCSDYWVSPSIWLSGAAVDAGTARADASGSHDNFVNVKVHSRSRSPKTVHVQIWPCNFLIAAAPAGRLPRVPLSGFIGEIAGVADGSPGEVEIRGWKPRLSDLDAVPGHPAPPSAGPGLAHICLVANCFTRDTEPGGPDGFEITSATQPFGYCAVGAERHHGQKNILVQKLTPEGAPLMELVLGALNPHHDAREFTVDIADVGGRLSREHLVFLLQGGHVVHARDPHVHAEVPSPDEVGPLNGRFVVPETDGTVVLRRSPFPLRHLELRSDGHGAAKLRLRIPPLKQVPVTIRAAFDERERPGMYRVLRLRQRDAHNRNMGGADLIVLRLP